MCMHTHTQTWVFHKANIPEAPGELEAFAVKLMKHGVSLLDYSRNFVDKPSSRYDSTVIMTG